MAKVKKAWFCQNCGAQHSQWMGQCSRCHEWNTLVEEVLNKPDKRSVTRSAQPERKSPTPIRSIEYDTTKRTSTCDAELDRVLGGGIVPGSLILLGGEPGIGKSTLMLQVALRLKTSVLYVSGEESDHQVRMRAERIGIENEDCLVLTETRTQNIFQHAETLNPGLVVVDSIQTLSTEHLEASPGSVSQIRECAAEFLQFAKTTGIPVILIGHITKEGSLAGPKVLEHMVDVVLQFEGDRHHIYRLLRGQKNRFGSTSELGIYEMRGEGLREVPNPSEVLLSGNAEQLSGTAIAVMVEGVRPMLVEIQALVSTAVYGTPQRSSTGFDVRRLNMLLAVLEKRCGFRLGAKDVFLNVTGGIKVDDPAIDLAVVAAILSSDQDMPIGQGVCFAGEVGLAGEIRPANRIDHRVNEAAKLGFDQAFVSKAVKLEKTPHGIDVMKVAKVEDLVRGLFG
ncbi:DNA repair protein RadA [Phaeocystidibacter luteus]|uniref:DNA repair protein RadA n=1 Tax=Phaeocystidibacter luteus TaxID=911197 RepID=A0A6N6RKW5_9FLAO|nr:DNA repair protein RadA [Phaeocystidibacter luteus]KAB2813989.1 DNA repair protein RadA [Phaeocystidibacter luteus]